MLRLFYQIPWFFTNKTFFFLLVPSIKNGNQLCCFPRVLPASSSVSCHPGEELSYSPLMAACSLVQFHGKTEQKVLLSKALQKEGHFHLKSSSSSRSLPCRAENAQGSGGLSLWGKRVIKDTQLCVGAITGWETRVQIIRPKTTGAGSVSGAVSSPG